MLEMIRNDKNLRNRIMWTDEAIFTWNVQVNRHNCVYWASENPKLEIKKKANSPGLTVWGGICSEGIIGPYIFDEKVNAKIDLKNFYFIQDGAPAHNSNIGRTFLNEKFPHKWMGAVDPLIDLRGGSICQDVESPTCCRRRSEDRQRCHGRPELEHGEYGRSLLVLIGGSVNFDAVELGPLTCVVLWDWICQLVGLGQSTFVVRWDWVRQLVWCCGTGSVNLCGEVGLGQSTCVVRCDWIRQLVWCGGTGSINLCGEVGLGQTTCVVSQLVWCGGTGSVNLCGEVGLGQSICVVRWDWMRQLVWCCGTGSVNLCSEAGLGQSTFVVRWDWVRQLVWCCGTGSVNLCGEVGLGQ
ncbi:hypothetical protein LAZ67_3005830 [Cordylochernes scorpioides]|uniref:Transposase n=1 Tax=Cordylochernes scorpioides TaxID=51811 RepID=A0ABY6KAL8_9ARAC|nr:hypothetical protein LAZ67_3005830 [Cordylochernes scorpioides]